MYNNNTKKMKSILTMVMLAGLPIGVWADVLHGTVRNMEGAPLVGVTVFDQNTRQGVTTDESGNYTITTERGHELRFSYLGFQDQSYKVNGNQLDVKMKDDVHNLDELVVVGYGVQKRRDIIGAVSSVGGDVLENRSNPNITRSLQGQVPGLNITMVDGKPIRTGSIYIRGNINSIGAGGSALILVDGVEGEMNAVNPEDVESITVLKDASSTAIYGARGAFGVILITTKKAKTGKPSIVYSGNVSIQSRTVKPEMVTNGLQWTTDFYNAYMNYKGKEPSTINNRFNKFIVSWEDWYSELQRRDADPTLEKIRINSAGYYDYFGNTDWFDEFYKDSYVATQHNISMSGGSQHSTYLFSAGYYGTSGIYKIGDENFHRYNLRAKGTLKLNSWLSMSDNIELWRRTYHEPAVMYAYTSSDMSSIIPIQRQIETQGYPVATLRNLDGTWTEAAVYTGYAGMYEGTSWREIKKLTLKNTVGLTADIIKDVLQATGDFTYSYTNNHRDQVGNLYTGYISPTSWVQHQNYSYLETRFYDTEYISGNATLTFTPRLGDSHHLKAMGGWNLESEEYRTTRVLRQGLLVQDKPNFNLMDGESYYIQDNGSSDWAFVGVFYRLNYDYKGRYLLEASGRYDGSSKFPTSQQWGFFPSGSVGWRVTEEPWMRPLRDTWLNNLKFRFSLGEAGNGLVSPYQYVSTMSISKSSVVKNGNFLTYTNAPAPVPNSLTWEKVRTYDFGVDLDMFNNRLNLCFDIYRKNTTDMYVVGDELPAVYGNSAPKGNNADMRTDGVELSISWKDHVMVGGSPLHYSVKAAFWDNHSKITKYTSTTNTLPTIYSTQYYKGMDVGEIWGFKVAGYFQNNEDVANSPSQSWFTNYNGGGTVWEAGDLKFVDVNGDKKIDNGNGTLDNHGDLVKIGNTTPRYNYSFTLSGDWKGIGLSMFWQGVGKRNWYPAKESSLFWGMYGRPYGFDLPWQNASTEAGVDADGNLTNPNAYWPRFRSYIAEVSKGPLALANDKYLQNAAYLRLKNINVSYTFPKKMTRQLGIQKLMVYVAGENLLTFSPLHKHAKNFDPEVITAGDPDGWNPVGEAGDGYSYPMMKSVSFGLNITF
jgi:TonB-linked SusC/RagA family outer membrane protein